MYIDLLFLKFGGTNDNIIKNDQRNIFYDINNKLYLQDFFFFDLYQCNIIIVFLDQNFNTNFSFKFGTSYCVFEMF